MKQYKGIIFNSVNVGLLNGELGRVVTANNIRTAEVSHNSQEGIEGAQAIAAAIFIARTGHSKQEIKKYIEETFGYDLDKTVAEHRATRSKNYVCSQSGPEAIRCWLEADTYEQTIRNAVSLRTDADTVADIAGAIAAATPGMEVPQ